MLIDEKNSISDRFNVEDNESTPLFLSHLFDDVFVGDSSRWYCHVVLVNIRTDDLD